MDVVSVAASVVALVEISVKVASLCAEYYSQVKSAQNDIHRFHLEVEALIKVLQNLHQLAQKPGAAKLFTSNALDESIRSCLSDLRQYKEKLEPGKGRKAMSRYGIRALKWPFESKELEKVIGVLERYKSTFSTALNVDQTSLLLDFGVKLDSDEQDRCLSKLPYADGANFDSPERHHEPYCLPNTRVDILQQIMEWSADPGHKSIFWLNGMAGTGKSTIARTITRTLTEQKRYVANFFFSRGRGDLSHTSKLFSTIAIQLAERCPALRNLICEAIAEHKNISRQSIRDQWTKLIHQPLMKLSGDLKSPLFFVVVIDALDECGRQEDIPILLQLLREVKDLRPVQLRVLVTSRPDTPIQLGFHAIPGDVHEDFMLHTISPAVVRHDIAIFLRHELNKIRESRPLPLDWPGEQKLKILVERSSGLFIYAATVCRFVQNPNWLPKDRLDIALRGSDDGQSPTQRLDEMYIQILRSSIIGECTDKEKSILSQRFRDTVGPIVVLFDSLSSVALTGLLPNLSGVMDITLESLKSIISVPEDHSSPIRLLHPSFRDFLLDRNRCSDGSFWIDEGKTHYDIAQQCLAVMSKTLKRNICHLKTPGTLRSQIESTIVDRYLPPHIQYACQYWVGHLQKGSLYLHNSTLVYDFLQDHFLHWLEALSLIGKIAEAVLMIKMLGSIPEFQADIDLLAFVNDAKRIILDSRYIAEMAPLQLYNSSLVFSPEASIVKRQFLNELPKWIERLPIVEKDWTPSLQALEGHSDWITAVVFSPDGQLLASASHDKTVRLWDPATGASRGTLEGHSGWITAVVFSPDGQLLASASGDKTVRLWDPATGASRGTLEGHSGWIRAVVFSPDGQLLASASDDKTVRLWDIKTGTVIQQIEHNYNERLSFNQDGSQLEIDWTLLQISGSSLEVSPHWQVLASASYSIDVTREWVTYKGYNVLWLPPNRRPDKWTNHSNIIALGNGSGRVTILKFSTIDTPSCT